jgi:putative ABC transport system ATP-binding protein
MSGEDLIKIENLEKSFPVREGEVKVLKGLNFTIKKGEFVIIFGPSGCGKSTLLHCLLGLEPPSSGKVLVENEDFYKGQEDDRALYRRSKVGMIYQQPLWIHSLDVFGNVAFPLQLLDTPEAVIKEKIDAVLKTIGIEEKANYMPTELSSGQQQKISLARALALDPLLIVADEPTGNLDTVSGQELIDLFRKLASSGKTIIMVTHDLEYLKYGDKLIHMLDGEIVEQKSVAGHKLVIAGKRGLGEGEQANVRDREFLGKLKL